MSNFIKKQKGITLIALVITIIVLLILAGVAISMLSGENGILTQAGKAKTEYEAAQKQEEAQISDLEVITDLSVNNTPYKFSNGYLTGVIIEKNESNESVAENVSELKDKLPDGYSIYNIDGSDITNEDVPVTTGMMIKKGNEEIGRIVIYGDLHISNKPDGKICGNLDATAVNFIRSKSNVIMKYWDVSQYLFYAADLNHDGLINWYDERIARYVWFLPEARKDIGSINQNVAAIKIENKEQIVDENTSKQEYYNAIPDSNSLKDKFTWVEGSTNSDGYYEFTATSGDTVQDILNALPNKKTKITKIDGNFVEEIALDEPLTEEYSISVMGEINNIHISLEIAKIKIST